MVNHSDTSLSNGLCSPSESWTRQTSVSNGADLVTRSKPAVIQDIQQLVPPGTPQPEDPETLKQLGGLTAELIRTYQAAEQLFEDPFSDVWHRTIHLYEALVREKLQDQVVLVTGGEGFVGTCLIERLKTLGVKRIVSVDKVRWRGAAAALTPLRQDNTALYPVDIRDYPTLRQIFELESPQLVFHLAAQRLPGLAEIEVWETVSSNVFGTQNIIRLCEEFQVRQCVFSSTGKASRYLTAEVYAASKKFAEWQFTQASQRGKTTYSMVRFTHMLNNSSFCAEYDRKVAQGEVVNIHAPNRYIVGQNVTEAVHLLLNGLVVAEPKRNKFILCRNLGWPVETLEVALYKILDSGKNLPIYFQGVLPGYEESFFRGQVNWDRPTEINTLINTIETSSSTFDQSGDLIVSPASTFDDQILDAHLAQLQALISNPETPQALIKRSLAAGVRAVALSIYAQADPDLLAKILKWGTDPQYLEMENSQLEAHEPMIRLMVESWYLSQGKEMAETVQMQPLKQLVSPITGQYAS